MGNYSLDFNETYTAVAADNTVHDIGLEDVSISVRANVDSAGMDTSDYVITKYIGTGTKGWTLNVYDAGGDQISFMLRSGGLRIRVTGSTNVRDDEWHHHAFRMDRDNSANCKYYLDGVHDEAAEVLHDPSLGSIANDATLIFGKRTGSESYKYDGSFYDLRLYYAMDDYWSDAEIAYQSRHPLTNSRHAGLLTERWRCNEGAGLIINGSQGNHLTLTSEDAWLKMPFEWTTEAKIQAYLDAQSVIVIGDEVGDTYPLGDAERLEYDIVQDIKSFLSPFFSALPNTPPEVLVTATSKLTAAAIGQARMAATMGNDLAEWTERLANQAWARLQQIALSQRLESATPRSVALSERLILAKMRERSIVPNV